MEKELPKGWVETELGAIGEIVTGNTPSKSIAEYYGDEVLWVKPGDFYQQKIIFKTEEKLSELGFQKSRKVPAGSILVTCIGNLGNISMASEDLATNQQINSIVIPHDKLSKKYVFYYSLTLKKWLIENSTSTTISMVNKSVFEKAPIIFPPLPEQERIVAKLEKLFAQHEKIKTALARIPQLLKTFRQQVLTQAVTGKLTEQWREGKELEGWREEKMDNVTVSISDGDHQAPPKSDIGIPFLVISDVSSGKLDVKKSKRFVPAHYYGNLKENRKPKLNDILYTVTGSFGIPIIIDTEEPFCFQRHIGIVRPDNAKVQHEFLFYFLKSNLAYSQAVDCATGTAQLTVSLGGLRNFKMSTPPLKEQQEIVRQVESLFAKADAIESSYQTLKGKIDSLPQAILHKAFKGELVPQLPTDGDAKDLLAEIIKLKEEAKPKKTKKNRSI